MKTRNSYIIPPFIYELTCPIHPIKAIALTVCFSVRILHVNRKEDAIMDSYTQFQLILNKWIGFAGRMLGSDILNKDFKVSGHTVIVLISSLLVPVLYGWTIYAFQGDLAVGALGYFGFGVDVR